MKIIIKEKKGLANLDIKEIWHFRELFYFFMAFSLEHFFKFFKSRQPEFSDQCQHHSKSVSAESDLAGSFHRGEPSRFLVRFFDFGRHYDLLPFHAEFFRIAAFARTAS